MTIPTFNPDCPGYCFGCECILKEYNVKQVFISKLFQHDSKPHHLSIWQLGPGQPFYVKCPKGNKQVIVATSCISCDCLRGFSYEKRYLDCRG